MNPIFIFSLLVGFKSITNSSLPQSLTSSDTLYDFTFKAPIAGFTFQRPLLSKIQKINKSDSVRNLFLFYIDLASPFEGEVYKPQALYRVFFWATTTQQLYINLNKIYAKWKSTHQLLYNIFYSQSRCLLFSSKVFTSEVNSWNWETLGTNRDLFRHVTPFIFYQNIPFGDKPLFLFETLTDYDIECVFFFDIRLQHRTLAFLRQHNFYTFGLTAYTENPWLVHYPIPVAISNLFTQFFFLNLLTLIKQEALLKYFEWNVQLIRRLD